MDSPISYKIGPAAESHLAFVYNSFLQSYRGTFPLYIIDRATYFRVYHDIMEKAITGLGVLVAHNPDDPDHILGYVVGNAAEIAYVYVKQDYRGLGIATDLVKVCLQNHELLTGHPPVKHSLLTRSGYGLLQYLKSYVLQDVDFCYELPTEVKKKTTAPDFKKIQKAVEPQGPQKPSGVGMIT